MKYIASLILATLASVSHAKVNCYLSTDRVIVPRENISIYRDKRLLGGSEYKVYAGNTELITFKSDEPRSKELDLAVLKKLDQITYCLEESGVNIKSNP